MMFIEKENNMLKFKSFRWIVTLMLVLIAAAFVGLAVLAQDDSSITFELPGVIEAMDATTITVHGQVMDITQAEISATLEVGLAIRVHGMMLPDGRMVALEVHAVQSDDILPGEVEIIGVWPAEVGNTVVIGGLTFDLSSAEIDSNIVAGDLVVVHATLSTEGVWVVREVKLFEGNDNGTDNTNHNGNTNDNGNDNADDNSNDNAGDNSNDNTNGGTTDEFELTGTLESVGDSSIVVSGATIDTTSAEIHGTLIIGALVKVHVTSVDGRMIAREVELVSPGNSNDNGNDNQNDNTGDNSNDNTDENSNDNEGGGLPTIPGDCVASMPGGWTTYTIQSGDTLSSIASRSGASMGDLMQANCIADPGMIVAGTSIFVPRTPDPVGNSNDNNDDNANSNDNSDDNANSNDNGGGSNDNSDDHGGENNNDNSDDSNDNGGGSNDNSDDHGGENNNDNSND
jgi:LysM repeat protein